MSKIVSAYAVARVDAPVARSKTRLERSRLEWVREITVRVSNCSALFCDGKNDVTPSQRPGAPRRMHLGKYAP